ncbi:hypothetical protein J7T55_014562 [Diaporthe amygdali]|uniref:uncharacterized protein n=1 Tax=Phomopsis amygdali TaxID=1214568 RepID=UPI0022FE2A02|nr:uncharacterized protein J7T55_014562 [Diaporthe amygdali]KAJ0118109.1 hypothetical protein J7T55_014562 [Diaporthe amygdali]
MDEMHVARNISVISIPQAVEASTSTGGQVSLGLSYFLTVFSTMMMILRFWSRRLSRFGIGLDDWLALATLIMLYIVLGLSVALVYEGGVGKTMAQAVKEQPMSPVMALKLSSSGNGVCHFRVEVYLIIVAAPNIVIDTLTIILPVYEVWHLQLERWKRIAVSGIFVVGGMVVVASIVRLIFLVAFYFKHSADLTFNLLLPWFVTLAEIGVGIVGACLPCLMPLYRRFWHDTSGSKPSGYGGQSSLRSHIPGRTIGSNTVIAGHSGGKKGLSGLDESGHPFERLPTGALNDDLA